MQDKDQMRGLLAMPLCLALFAAAPAVAQPLVLKLSHFLGPTSFFQHDFAEPWAKQLEARTDGAVRMEIYNAASPFGDVTKQATQVRDGTIDIALGLRGAEGDRFPRSSIIELPFVVHDALSGSRALWDLYTGGVLDDEYKDYKVLALFVHNPGLIHTAGKRIVAPDDLTDQRLRAPDNTVAGALQSLGATAVILQVNEVMPAVKDHRIDGIVTNWGNPLPDFNDYMKYHTDIAFYTLAFFVLMDRRRFENLPANIRTAIDELSGSPLVTRLGLLWNKWDRAVRDGASGPDQEIIVPDEAVMQQWRAVLQPFTEHYLGSLVAGGFTDARAVYASLIAAQQR
jgi:TRAP-type C4-dicarboxylate transport system substrate-binding protein